ncbi:magnesium transporter [Lichenifustis flavocetrariae]|uniref:magnesium transporter n=1 Tax=Lichenifustis flavocetrariae TaxID=2949735 RepID=UPI003D12467C
MQKKLPSQDVFDPTLTRLDERPADTAERLNRALEPEAVIEVAGLPVGRAVDVFDQPFLTRGARLLRAIPAEQARAILDGMAVDRQADVFRQAEKADRDALFPLLDDDVARIVRTLLAYPRDSAGSLMTTEFVSVQATATVAEVLDHIRAVHHTRETIYPIYVINPSSGRLEQTVSLRRLITASPGDPILTHCSGRAPITTTASADREDVARLIAHYDLLAVPVVDDARCVLGIVTVDDVLDAVVAESTEDVQRFGGVAGAEGPYLEIGFGRMLSKRAGWLCALFLSEMLTASAMQHFETELEKAVVLTLFIPLIMSSGGNSGSQATSLLIRALALGQLRLRDWWRVAIRELPVGMTLGAILGAIGVLRIAVWQQLGIYDYGVHWPLIALTVGAGLIGIVTFGSMAGSMLPFILKRLGFDPASASAPFVATLVDVTGLVIYFRVALVILHGTLL